MDARARRAATLLFTTAAAIFALDRLTKVWAAHALVDRPIDLIPGARVGLIGPNGAGKTTFVNLLTGFLAPDAGTINLEGVSIERMKVVFKTRSGALLEIAPLSTRNPEP